MALTPGTRIGVYEVTGQIGEGGMGQVFRARDTKLHRDVALKVLPDAFASDHDRLARFTREAQTLASVNHPNIAHIHDLVDSDGVGILVMEFVEGEDLAQRIARGPIPLDEALPIAKQIAEGLEAAHEQGIIHRDLKPANIKVRSDGTVKVLDFGLAKAVEPISAAPNMSRSPTITTPAMTQAGIILGTAAYMAPEQARGKAVDRRADIWAFGAVLYEMVTGRGAFEGDDISITLAAVLMKEPDWSAVPATAPPSLRRMLRRCLEKEPKRRLQAIGEARVQIEDILAGVPEHIGATVTASEVTPFWRRALPWTVAAASLLATVVVLALWAPWRVAPDPARVAFELPNTNSVPGQSGPLMFAVSPDGTQVVSRVLDGDIQRLSVRPLGRLEGVALMRTEGASHPFWSPDSHAVGFIADGKLKTVDLAGGVPQTLTDASGNSGGTWSRDGVILFTPSNTSSIYRVAASGGHAAPVTQLNSVRGDTSHRFPRFLPDGVHFLYLVRSSRPESRGIYVGSLASRETHRLVDAVYKPEFAPPDLVLFARESTLMAQRLDGRLQVLGVPFRVVEPVRSNVSTGSAGFSVSDNGVLAYRPGFGGETRELAWMDRSGKLEGTVGAAAGYENPRLSPDGRQLAVFRAEGGGDIWITDLKRRASARFTLDPASDNVPLWSPDGKQIAFISNRDGGVFNIYQKHAGGTGPEELLLKTPHHKQLNDWSPNGRYLVYQEDDPQTKSDLWMLPLVGDRKPSKLLATPFNESEATLAPNGQWMAYTSDESGGRQVYVRKFPSSDRKWQVSVGSLSAHPRWGLDGKEVFFDVGGQLAAVSVAGLEGSELALGAPRLLFSGLLDLPPHNFDVTGAGQRFLVVLPRGTTTGAVAPITVVLNWKSELSLPR